MKKSLLLKSVVYGIVLYKIVLILHADIGGDNTASMSLLKTVGNWIVLFVPGYSLFWGQIFPKIFFKCIYC